LELLEHLGVAGELAVSGMSGIGDIEKSPHNHNHMVM
jgi:hypothetical protein